VGALFCGLLIAILTLVSRSTKSEVDEALVELGAVAAFAAFIALLPRRSDKPLASAQYRTERYLATSLTRLTKPSFTSGRASRHRCSGPGGRSLEA
jgi:hypothetical protein